jgi:hypothetical protein
MRDQDYVDKAKLSPARIFKSPMDVVDTTDIRTAEKLAILLDVFVEPPHYLVLYGLGVSFFQDVAFGSWVGRG